MTTPTPLAETIAELQGYIDTIGEQAACGALSVRKGELTLLLACARRCEAIERMQLDSHTADVVHAHLRDLRSDGARNDQVVRCLTVLLDAAAGRERVVMWADDGVIKLRYLRTMKPWTWEVTRKANCPAECGLIGSDVTGADFLAARALGVRVLGWKS